MPPFAKRQIKNSFLKLLNEHPITQITVKEIVEDCGVNRNSFYYHFQDIPSLLEEIIVEVTDKVIVSLPEDASFEEQVTIVLELIDENKRIVQHIFSSSNSSKMFYEKQLMRICEYVTRSYIDSREYSRHVNMENKEFIVSFLKCEAYGQLVDWLNHDMSYDIVKHSRRLCRMFAGSIRNVSQRYRKEGENRLIQEDYL